MKIKNSKTIIAVVVIIVIVGFIMIRPGGQPSSQTTDTKDLYYCPMHPNFTSDKPGECAICGMTLVKRQTSNQPVVGKSAESEKKILYYRNPMNPAVTSPVPMKDQMGMDYVPVYEEEQTPQAAGSVYISSQKQQLIGVKKQKIEKRRLAGQILTVGVVAYDPDLFVAQEEYLQTIQTQKAMQSSNFDTKEQLDPLVKAAKRKLLLFGMSEAEIAELEKKGKPQQYLYLPEEGNVWVYITIYEYETAFIKEALPVQVETVAYPGRVFEGSVVSIAPIVDKTVRTLKVRALVKDPENKLKPEMYVDVKILYDLGEKLAVPEGAVMDSGTRKIVYIAEPNGYFEPKEVKLGPKIQGFYEVLQGLTENQTVVTSGNFLVDSESKLNAVLTQMSEPNQ